MNKDVIYIEPENDITDIIDKVKTSKTTLVALVPPKKSAVLGSAVNFKLLARASRAAGKKLVLVTSDAGLLKLASLAEIPAAKNLQTRPEIPLLVKDNSAPKEIVESSDLTEEIEGETPAPAATAPDEDIEIVEAKKDSEDAAIDAATKRSELKDDKDPKKSKKKSGIPNFDRFRKWIILGSIGAVLIIGFLVWALVFAPAAKIVVSIRTTGDNFSSAVSFVTDPKKEIIEEGIFALESADLSKKVSANFAATGEVNKGDKASGTITAFYDFTAVASDPISIASGTTFTNGGHTYASTSAATLSFDSESCETGSHIPILTCRISAKIPVTANGPGEEYNNSNASGWTSSNTHITVIASSIAGGTNKIIKTVSQEDFDKAKSLLSSTSESAGRNEVIAKFPASTFPLEGSLKVDSKPAASSPKVGEEAAEGVTPTISAETVFSMYGVDRGKISQFIEQQLTPTITQGQKIFSTGVSNDPELNKTRIENYKVDGDKITAKLTSYGVQIGPNISEAEIFEKSRGRKIGEVRTLIKPLIGSNGNIDITTSVFWVTSIPDDINKVEVIIELEK